MRCYAEHLLATVAPRTAASVLIGLKVVVMAMHREGSWRWLMDLTNRLNTWAEPSVDRTAQTLPIEQIHNAALRELDRLQQTPLVRRIDRVAYRDTLIVLLLSAAPVRMRNLAMIDIGTHLEITAGGATLRFAENETKNRQRLTHPLPRHLLPYLQLGTSTNSGFLGGEPGKGVVLRRAVTVLGFGGGRRSGGSVRPGLRRCRVGLRGRPGGECCR